MAVSEEEFKLLKHGKLEGHLADDAPCQRCGRCGRYTWAVSEFDGEDRMTQPDGSPCGGRFGG